MARLLAKRVRDARVLRGWDQSELARRAGISPSYVSRLESAAFDRPSAERLASIAAALGRRVSDLIDPPAPPPDTDELRREVAARIGPDHAKIVSEIVEVTGDWAPDERGHALEIARNIIMNWHSTKHRRDES